MTDAEPVPLAEALREAFGLLGRRVRVLPVGYRPALAAAAVSGRAHRAAGRPGEPVLTPYTAAHLALERTFDLRRARDLLGHRPGPTDFSVLWEAPPG